MIHEVEGNTAPEGRITDATPRLGPHDEIMTPVLKESLRQKPSKMNITYSLARPYNNRRTAYPTLDPLVCVQPIVSQYFLILSCSGRIIEILQYKSENGRKDVVIHDL